MEFLVPLFFFYAAAFASLAFLPRWWLLLPAAAGALALYLWTISDLRAADGPGVIFAIPLVFFAGLGFAAGFLARATLLSTRSLERAGLRTAVVLPIAFIAAPAIFWIWSTWSVRSAEARRAPPSATCLTQRHPATLGDLRLSVPLVPTIALAPRTA